jgi:hypothetical protein
MASAPATDFVEIRAPSPATAGAAINPRKVAKTSDLQYSFKFYIL